MNCPVCGHQNADGARFCSNCGTRLVELGPVDGERKLVSVLFADVAGSTRLTELLGGEEWATIMNGAFSLMNRSVAKYGGTVGRLMGDGILAFFGVPMAHEDDAERAVLAGLELRDAADAYGDDLAQRYKVRLPQGIPPFAVRVGVSTGQTVLTTVGDDVRAEFTAMGETANLAARLQSLAEAGGILIDTTTHGLVQHAVEALPLGAKQVKGIARPVQVFEVLGVMPGGERRRGIEGLSSPIVGRDVEMTTLRDRVRRLARDEGSFVCLIGEAGLGKSRMVADLRKLAAHDVGRAKAELGWYEGRALSYASSLPYFALRGTLLDTMGLTQADARDQVREALARATAQEGWEGERHRPYLELLLAVEDEATADSVRELDGTVLTRRISEAVLAYVRWFVKGPTVLVFEDIHWADTATVRLLSELAALTAPGELPLMILAVTRPDRQSPAWRLADAAKENAGGAYVELKLAPLDENGSRELLTQLLGGEDLGPVLARVLERSDGNPFYLEEVLRSLIEAGHVTRENGRWVVKGDIEDAQVPGTLEGVLSARIDRLPERARQVAQTAAVVGRTFPRSVVDSVFSHPSNPWRLEDVGPQLETLSTEEFVRLMTGPPDEEYAFKHVLTQEAAYGRLLTTRRALLHRLVAEVLERQYVDRLADAAAMLAHHFESAEQWLKAADYYRTAGDRALRLNELTEALRLYDAALKSLDSHADKVDQDAAWLFATVHTLAEWVRIATIAKRHEDAEFRREQLIPQALRNVDLARRLEDDQALVRALVQLGNVYVLSGEPGTGFGYLLEAHDLAEDFGDQRVFLLPLWASTELILNDDPGVAEKRFAEIIDIAHGQAGDRAVEAHALASRAVALARMGRFEESLALMPRALEAADASGSVIKVADVNMLIGGALMDMGHGDLGLRYVMYGRDKALSIEGRECATAGLLLTGIGELARRQIDPAIQNLDLSEEMAVGTVMESHLYNQRAARAACEVQRGDVTAAERLREQLERAEAMQDGYGRSMAAMFLAESLVDSSRPEEALLHAGSALEWYRERGMTPYVIRGLKVLAAADEALGRQPQADAARSEAARLKATLPVVDPSFLGEPGTERAVQAVA